MPDHATTSPVPDQPQVGAGGRVYRRQYEPAVMQADFETNKQVVLEKIAAAARRVDRSPDEVRLLAVSKTVETERLREAAAAGLLNMAENKVQEGHSKWNELADLGISWSMIGHLQTNKAKFVAEYASEFQALDSVRVAEALDRRLQTLGKGLDVLIQVNVSGEDTKSGVAPGEVDSLLGQLAHFDALNVRGFMTIARNSTDETAVRESFGALRQVRERARQIAPAGMDLTELSMGMSGDYEIAIEEGATTVRVGSALFGSRYYPV